MLNKLSNYRFLLQRMGLTWLHEVRRKMREEQKKSGISDTDWIKKVTREAEKIIGRKIPKVRTSAGILVK